MSLNKDFMDRSLESKTILCVIDEESANPHIYRRLVATQLKSLQNLGAHLVLLHVDGRADKLPEEYQSLVAELLIEAPIEGDSPNQRSRKLAQRAVKYGTQNRFDVVIGFGWTLSRGVSGGQALANKFWAFVDDATDVIDRALWTNAGIVDALYKGARKVFVFSDERRSILENTSSAANGRTYLPAVGAVLETTAFPQDTFELGVTTRVILPGLTQPTRYIDRLSELSELAKSGRSIYQFLFDGARETWDDLQNEPKTAVAAAIPGLELLRNYENDQEALVLGLVPDTPGEEWLSRFLIGDYMRNGVVPISIERFLSLDHGNPEETVSVTAELSCLGIDSERLEEANKLIIASTLDTLGGNSEEGKLTVPRKVVLVGADFKFAGDLVELLNESSDFDLRIDLWANNSHPNPAKSTPFVEWADVVICEFASFNAIWYSQNKRPNQKLIVRLHGYELLQPWIDQLVIDNVDQVVFVSDFYRRKAIDDKGWDEAKTSVISNTVDFGDLSRDKFDGAEYHLGMAGYVPILKRPDRALDLLEELLKHDDQFVLHMRGHEPWNYQWEWKKPAHQAAYRDFYARIAADEKLRSHIAFESFGPDMAGWFRKIGWMLSPSYRETFHLAPVEGMASGSLPVVWQRDGANEIFPDDYVVADIHEAAQLILSTVADRGTRQRRANEARSFAARYSRSSVKSDWTRLIHTCADSKVKTYDGISVSNESLESLVEQLEATGSASSLLNAVSEAWRLHDYATAISLLDANIKLTANDPGELKQWEHWVRGIFQTAMSLESLLLKPAVGCVYEPMPNRAVIVTSRQPSTTSLKDMLEGFDSKTIGLELPVPGLEEDHVADSPGAFYEAPDYSVVYDGTLRSNYFLVQASSEIASICRDTAARVAVASGGIFESLATLIAARRVGIPFVWSPVASLQANQFLNVFDEIRNDDPVHEIFRAILANSDAVLDSGQPNLVQVSLKLKLPIWESVSSKLLESLSSRRAAPHTRRQEKLSIAYAGGGKSVEALSMVANIEICTLENVMHILDKAPDIFVLEFGETNINSSEYSKSARLIDTTNLPAIQKAILHSRVMGVRSLFISQNDPESLRQGKEIARKCDVLVSSDRKSLVSYMRLNPNSIQMAANISGGSRASVIPSISLKTIQTIRVCDHGNEYPALLEEGLIGGQPIVPGWNSAQNWVDSNQIGDHDAGLRYEASRNPEDGVDALWANCYELSQGRTGLDFAVSVVRAAGFPVPHTRGDNSSWIFNSVSGPREHSESVKSEVIVNSSETPDKELKRDLIAIHRVTGASEFEIGNNVDGVRTITIKYADGGTTTVSRVSETVKARPSVARMSEFGNSGVSVVIATYNGASRLPRLLKSIQMQRLPFALVELVIVPNGPDDGTTDLLATWSTEHPEISVNILSVTEAGVAKARNLGIAKATRDYITFVDDDDYLEPNYLLSLYSRAEDHTVILGKLSDVDEETGEIIRDTATNRRVNELSGRILPLAQRAGALGMNGAKLIPTWLTRECVYDSSLRSGEDVAFMAQLLINPGIFVTSAADVSDAEYMRVMRSNSISRRDESFEFMILERLDVMKLLLASREQSKHQGGKGAIEYLATGQLGFMKRFIQGSRSTADYERTLHEIQKRKMDSEKILQPLIATIKAGINDPSSMNDGKIIPLEKEF